MPIFDSHAHYGDERFAADREAVLAAQFAAGVDRILEVACEPADFKPALELAGRYAGIYVALGIHPHEASAWNERMGETLTGLFQDNPRAVALGEIGLDYHYDLSSRRVQQTAFDAQLTLAHKLHKPVVLHVREAYGDAMDILRAHRRNLQGVMHCFSGSPEIARQCLDWGLYIAFGGSVTFNNARRVVESAAVVPLDRLLIETDCPYLAPAPHRGERNDSRLLPLVIQKLAEIHGVPPATIQDATYRNACEVFGIPQDA